jgi:hypothetical protein
MLAPIYSAPATLSLAPRLNRVPFETPPPTA